MHINLEIKIFLNKTTKTTQTKGKYLLFEKVIFKMLQNKFQNLKRTKNQTKMNKEMVQKETYTAYYCTNSSSSVHMWSEPSLPCKKKKTLQCHKPELKHVLCVLDLFLRASNADDAFIRSRQRLVNHDLGTRTSANLRDASTTLANDCSSHLRQVSIKDS